MSNNKGSEKWLSIWWYLCLAVVIVGVVIVTYRFQNITDASALDAKVLTENVADCVAVNEENVFNGDFNINLCSIQFNAKKDYFVGVQLYPLSKCVKNSDTTLNCTLEKEFDFEPESYRNGNLKERCITLEGIGVSGMPDCIYRTIPAEHDNGNYFIRIIGATHE